MGRGQGIRGRWGRGGLGGTGCSSLKTKSSDASDGTGQEEEMCLEGLEKRERGGGWIGDGEWWSRWKFDCWIRFVVGFVHAARALHADVWVRCASREEHRKLSR